MKVSICAIAKCENNYINDWVNYHLNLGVDNIFIFDNNDPSYERVESKISIKTGKVYIIKIPYLKGFQTKIYNKFYSKSTDDWILFIDIDEYVVLNKWKNIKDFLNDNIFSSCNVIRLNWRMFGDDDKISRPMIHPVNEEITTRIAGHKYESHGKEIIRGNLSGINIVSSHYCLINNKLPKQIMPDGKETIGKVGGLRDCSDAYINHYMTKTLSEFIAQKIERKTDAGFPDRVIDLEYYWDINKKTPEKLKYLKDKGIK